MRTNRFLCFEKKPEQVKKKAGEELQKYQKMGGQISTRYCQIESFEADSEITKCKHPRTEKITSAKPEAVVLKRRRAFSECENSSAEKQRLCKKLKVKQLYTEYCGRNSFMAAFFRLLDLKSVLQKGNSKRRCCEERNKCGKATAGYELQ
ncbi:hypothetical protein AWC38_SpisGene8131 [Stylophora pistillata]|uniref:Uncharacterized protein n=1 Tax=Stylophora pistillata TaxID=50429 RepID=A0A2B4SFG5_STYPI|nr:hypothetical protein AWC38_SpisGene8131 [Stylophora pistillata]